MTHSRLSTRHPHVRYFVTDDDATGTARQHTGAELRTRQGRTAGTYISADAQRGRRAGSYITTAACSAEVVGSYVTTDAVASGPVGSYVSSAARA